MNLPWNGSKLLWYNCKLSWYDSKLPWYFNPRKSSAKITALIYCGILITLAPGGQSYNLCINVVLFFNTSVN